MGESCDWRLPDPVGWQAIIAVATDALADQLERRLPDRVDRERVAPSMAAAAARKAERAIVFADLEMAGQLQGSGPALRSVLLCEPSRLAELWPVAARCGADAVIDPCLLDDRLLASIAVSCALRSPWDMRPEMMPGLSCISRQISSSTGRDEAIKVVINRLEAHGVKEHDAVTLRLVVEELVNNALLHAFKPRAATTYGPGDFTGMREGDRVSIELALGDEIVVLGVTDSAGTLTGDRVRASIQRQLSGEGVLDSSGRGLFLGFSLGSLLAVNLEPGIRAQVVVAFRLGRSHRPNALLVNQVPDVDVPRAVNACRQTLHGLCQSLEGRDGSAR